MADKTPADEPRPQRAVAVWVPPNERPEAIEARLHAEKLAKMREAEAAAREALALGRIKLQNARGVIADLVLREMEKYLRLSQDPAFANTVGPLAPELILRLAEWVAKEDRLDLGRATEHIAHIVAPSIDFSKLSQEERDAWRQLAIKGGASDE